MEPTIHKVTHKVLMM